MSEYWKKGLEIMQSRRRWELYRAGVLPPSLPRDPIKFIANSQEMAIIRGCNLLVFSWYRREGVREAELVNHIAEGCYTTISLDALDNICVHVDSSTYDEIYDEMLYSDEFFMMWNGKTWERKEIGEDIDLDLTKSPFWPKGENNETY